MKAMSMWVWVYPVCAELCFSDWAVAWNQSIWDFLSQS